MVVQEIFGAGLGVLGGVMLFNAVKTYQASGRQHAYEPVEAQVLDSELEADSGIPGEATGTSYIPAITYEYTVEGETYVNDNVYPGPVTPGNAEEAGAQEVLDRYPDGATVEAFYDPKEPSVSFLERESQKRQAVGLAVLGIFVLCLGVLFVVWPL